MTQPGAGKRLASIAVLLFAALLGIVFSADHSMAQVDEYTVEKIPVDVTADSAAAARDKALLRAQREGLTKLAEKFGVSPPQISEARATDYVISIEIGSEKSSAVRYLADVTVHYNPVAVNRLLNRTGPMAGSEFPPPPPGSPESGLVAPGSLPPGMPMDPSAPSAVPSNAVLVIPVYEWSGARSLWDAANPWFLAWKTVAPTIAGRPTLVPTVESADIETVSAEQAIVGNRQALSALARRYELADVLVAHAIYEIDYRTSRPVFRLALTGYGPRFGGLSASDRVVGEPTEFVDELAKRAVASAATTAERNLGRGPGPSSGPLASAPDQAPPMAAGPERSMVAVIPLRGPADLSRARQQIGRLPMIVRDELVSLSRDEASVRLYYRGEPLALRSALGVIGVRPEDDGFGGSARGGAFGAPGYPAPASALR